MVFQEGDTVRFAGATDAQVNFGGGDDPRKVLADGAVYQVEFVDVHSWHTKLHLRGIPGAFNSVCFAKWSDRRA